MPARRIADARGRTWAIYDFSIIAGNTIKNAFGTGQYRGFVPVDGGARRTLLMFDADRARGTSDEVLLEQLAASKLYTLDNPEHCAAGGRLPERVDPPTTRAQ
jgi:putative cofactor-binding repeat protein